MTKQKKKTIFFYRLYGSAPGLNFASWMAFNVPGMIINTFLAWIWLQFVFIGFKRYVNELEISYLNRQIYRLLKASLSNMNPKRENLRK